MERLLRWGMVGGSMEAFIGGVHRKAMALYPPRVDFAAGCFSHRPDRNAATGETYGIDSDRVHADDRKTAEKEAAREDGIDLVSITTPNATHYREFMWSAKSAAALKCGRPRNWRRWHGKKI